MKGEPQWMRGFRLRALRTFGKKPIPQWGGNLNILSTSEHLLLHQRSRWRIRIAPGKMCPADIKTTFDRLGIPQARRKFLAGVGIV